MFPSEVKKKTMNEGRKVPYVCIKKSQSYSYCGRDPDSSELMFTDADYAIRHYGPGSTSLEVCLDCKERYLYVAKSSILDMTPSATRGLNDR